MGRIAKFLMPSVSVARRMAGLNADETLNDQNFSAFFLPTVR